MTIPHDRITGLPSTPIAGWSGRWAVGSRHLLDSNEGQNSRDLVTSDDFEALAALTAAISETTNSHSWTEVIKTPLLPWRANNDHELESREELLLENLQALAHVTHSYVTRIGITYDLLPVARIKKPARPAFDRLAGHSEDWAGRNLNGITPLRALAVNRIENVDLYENRMVTELLHPILLNALSTRIRRLKRQISDLADLNPTQHVGTYRRIQRLYEFWGADASSGIDPASGARGTVEKLENLISAIYSLSDSWLARKLRGKSTGSRHLLMTNVIMSDKNYRAVGEVWNAYQVRPIDSEKREQKIENLVKRHKVFDDYVFALIVRALDSLGFKPKQDFLPVRGEKVSLTLKHANVLLLRQADGTVLLNTNVGSTRIVPMTDFLAPNDDATTVMNRLVELQKSTTQPTVVVYLGNSSSFRNFPDFDVAVRISSGVDDSTEVLGELTAFPVSPIEVTSLERVTRAISYILRVPQFLDFPIQISPKDDPLPRRLTKSLYEADVEEIGFTSLFVFRGESLCIRRPLTEKEKVSLSQIINRLKDSSKGNGWEKDVVNQINSIEDYITRAELELEDLMHCPLCFLKAPIRSIRRNDDTFSITCSGCRSRWGLDRCGNCAERIPVIEQEQNDRNPLVSGPGWVERIFGQDVLASPCWSRSASKKYICPSCRYCSMQETPIGSNCVRCRKS